MQELSIFRRLARFPLFLSVFSVLFGSAGCGFAGTGPGSTLTGNPLKPASGPILISSGGTYSGNWTSNNPNDAAITIATDEPVVISNSTVSGRGTLINIAGTPAKPANVIIENVTGTAVAPGVAGMQRGRFVNATHVAVLQVDHCTMTGVSFGVYLANSTITSLSINNNSASDMEDRASDGHGGFTTKRPSLGHYVQLNNVYAPSGAEIAWNQVIDTQGKGSVEDIISIFLSRGGSDELPIRIHDNYLQGAFSTGASSYTGGGIITDGASNNPSTATGFVQIEDNQVVHTANYGVAIDAGHDIAASDNRVVSCGKNASGAWVATKFGQASILWNDFQSTQFFNNSLSGTSGGLVRPNASGDPMVADLWGPGVSEGPNNSVGVNSFTDPCIDGGDETLEPEYAEKAQWEAKLAYASQTVGAN